MYLIHFMLIQYFLYTFFPWPGPGTIATLPLSFIVALLTGVLHYFLIIFLKNKVIRAVTECLSILFLTYFYMSIYGEEPLEQFRIAHHFSKHQEEINYQDIFGDNYQKYGVKYAAALSKYKDSIPDAAFLVSYCCEGQKLFYIAKYGDVFITNNKRIDIRISPNKDTITLKEHFSGNAYTFKGAYNKFGKVDHWARMINMSDKLYNIEFRPMEFKANQGFCKWYYDYLIKKYR